MDLFHFFQHTAKMFGDFIQTFIAMKRPGFLFAAIGFGREDKIAIFSMQAIFPCLIPAHHVGR